MYVGAEVPDGSGRSSSQYLPHHQLSSSYGIRAISGGLLPIEYYRKIIFEFCILNKGITSLLKFAILNSHLNNIKHISSIDTHLVD